MNSITSLSPYRTNPGWAFDDPAVGLHREAFVAGADTLLDMLVPPDKERCVVTFSSAPFPRFQHQLVIKGSEHGGTVYAHVATGHLLWLCPALLKYFSEPPALLYFSVSF
jgi:hypothetical protein